MVGTAESVFIREVPLILNVLCREVPLYTLSYDVCKYFTYNLEHCIYACSILKLLVKLFHNYVLPH